MRALLGMPTIGVDQFLLLLHFSRLHILVDIDVTFVG